MYSKTAVKANRVDKWYRVSLIYLCKIHDSVIWVEYWYCIGVSSHSYIGHCAGPCETPRFAVSYLGLHFLKCSFFALIHWPRPDNCVPRNIMNNFEPVYRWIVLSVNCLDSIWKDSWGVLYGTRLFCYFLSSAVWKKVNNSKMPKKNNKEALALAKQEKIEESGSISPESNRSCSPLRGNV